MMIWVNLVQNCDIKDIPTVIKDFINYIFTSFIFVYKFINIK